MCLSFDAMNACFRNAISHRDLIRNCCCGGQVISPRPQHRALIAVALRPRGRPPGARLQRDGVMTVSVLELEIIVNTVESECPGGPASSSCGVSGPRASDFLSDYPKHLDHLLL